jgi:hypothetical protein
MLKSYKVKLFVLIFVLTIPICMYGQNSSSTSSPYSRFGFGTLSGTSFGRGDAMGGIGIGTRNAFQINTANPASYTSIDSLTFLMEFGIDARYIYSQTSSSSNNRNNVNFNHLTFALPYTKWWAGSFGILPYASKGYQVDVIGGTSGSTSMTSTTFSGTGTLTQIYLGNAFRLGKHFSVGLNTWFMFGKLADNTYMYFPYDNNAYDYMKNYSLAAHGFGVTGGFQYHTQTKKNNSFTLGVTFAPKININSTYTILEERALFRGGGTNVSEIVDTLQHVESNNNGLQIPMSYGTGLSYTIKEKVTIGADAYFQQWKDALFLGQHADYMTNSSRYSTGLAYVPNLYSIRSYWERVEYRFGGFYENSYLKLNGYQIKGYGVTFGIGLPLGRSRSALNLSGEIGQLGTTQNNLIRETYGKFTLHILLWDRWFFKSKFD